MAEHLTNLAANPTAEFGNHLVVGPMYRHGAAVRGAAPGRRRAQRHPCRFDAEATLKAIQDYAIGNNRDGAHPLRAPAGPAAGCEGALRP